MGMPGDELSLREALILQKRRENLTRLYDRGNLSFKEYKDGTKCGDCSMTAMEVKTERGIKIRPATLLDMDDMVLCESCFQRRFYIFPESGNLHAGAGNPHPTIPLSQMKYDGDYSFGEGER